MAVELWSTANTVPFLRGGSPLVRYETILQDAQRSGDMVSGTIMGRIGASGKWVPNDPTATDGSQHPAGLLARTLTEAEIQAGDVVDVPIICGGAEAIQVAASGLEIENGSLTSVITNPTNYNVIVREALQMANIYVIDDQDIEVAQSAAPPGP